MKRIINEYSITLFSYVSMLVGIEIVLSLFKADSFINFVSSRMYGL